MLSTRWRKLHSNKVEVGNQIAHIYSSTFWANTTVILHGALWEFLQYFWKIDPAKRWERAVTALKETPSHVLTSTYLQTPTGSGGKCALPYNQSIFPTTGTH